MFSPMHKAFAAALILLQLTGCSTVFGRHQDEEMVTFSANVQDVEVNCSGKQTVVPGSIPLRQSKSHSCTAVKDGYEKKAFRIQSGTSWAGFGHSTAINTALWGWWTLGIGTVVGWLIDWPSGAMRNLKEEDVYIEMKPANSDSAAEKVLDAAANVGKTLVNVPRDVLQETTSAALGTTVQGGANQLGIDTEETKKE